MAKYRILTIDGGGFKGVITTVGTPSSPSSKPPAEGDRTLDRTKFTRLR
jgi:hypothetical protein